jgi:hypothetical protein
MLVRSTLAKPSMIATTQPVLLYPFLSDSRLTLGKEFYARC